MHCAGATLGNTATEFRSREPDVVANNPQKRCRRIDVDRVWFAINTECDHKEIRYSKVSGSASM